MNVPCTFSGVQAPTEMRCEASFCYRGNAEGVFEVTLTNFDLFAWYGPFSGCGGPFGNHEGEAKSIQYRYQTEEIS